MAFVVCPIHGGHGADAVCRHVAGHIRRSEGALVVAGRLRPVRVAYKGFTLGPTWLCFECAESRDVPIEGALLNGDTGLEVFFCGIDWVPICPKCFGAVFPDAI